MPKSRCFRILMTLPLLLVIAGCNQSSENSDADSNSVDQNENKIDKAIRLTKEKAEIDSKLGAKLPALEGIVDRKLRMVDGIKIYGTAITDQHIKAIRDVTLELAKLHEGCETDTIVHDGPANVSRSWKKDDGVFTINLKLVEGKWNLGPVERSIDPEFGF